ncbi:hypothetical protein HH1059_03320 [Halorhodospira halochloris]|uniref:dTDP-glucose 4,6-dehydratase n=2 Tax=Halorhodospira halochloris TaxID=1052 RepID=A0A110B4P2_HALHR|nr:hypothetical protein [Halorhodospira halochloris]BAU57010.1 hypothetical protein HH1059_03320 [Halorhodospira halochloris]
MRQSRHRRRCRCPDLTKCREELGYEPQVPWREGVERTVRWYRDFFAASRQPDDIGFEPPEALCGAS